MDTLRIHLKHITRRKPGSIKRTPAARQAGIDNDPRAIDPGNRQISEYTNHMNGCIQTAVSSLYEKQAIIRRDLFPEG